VASANWAYWHRPADAMLSPLSQWTADITAAWRAVIVLDAFRQLTAW